MDNNVINYNTKENEFLRETLKESIKIHEINSKEWQKTIKFIIVFMCIMTLLTICIPSCVFFRYYFTQSYSEEIQAANTTTNINTNTNTNNNEE